MRPLLSSACCATPATAFQADCHLRYQGQRWSSSRGGLSVSSLVAVIPSPFVLSCLMSSFNNRFLSALIRSSKSSISFLICSLLWSVDSFDSEAEFAFDSIAFCDGERESREVSVRFRDEDSDNRCRDRDRESLLGERDLESRENEEDSCRIGSGDIDRKCGSRSLFLHVLDFAPRETRAVFPFDRDCDRLEERECDLRFSRSYFFFIKPEELDRSCDESSREGLSHFERCRFWEIESDCLDRDRDRDRDGDFFPLLNLSLLCSREREAPSLDLDRR